MAALRRSVVRLHQTVKLTQNQIPLVRRGFLLGSARYFSEPRHSGSIEIDLSDDEKKRRLFNRLLYRSRQRGFLELDLILGNWVEENIRLMDELRIRALVDVLDLENPDLWNYLTSQEQPPDEVRNNPVFAAVQSKVMENLKNHSAPETRAKPGQPWVRGWDDKRGMDGPKFGNQ